MQDCMCRHLADVSCSSQNDQNTPAEMAVVIVAEGAASNHSLGEGDKLQLLKIEFFTSPRSF